MAKETKKKKEPKKEKKNDSEAKEESVEKSLEEQLDTKIPDESIEIDLTKAIAPVLEKEAPMLPENLEDQLLMAPRLSSSSSTKDSSYSSSTNPYEEKDEDKNPYSDQNDQGYDTQSNRQNSSMDFSRPQDRSTDIMGWKGSHQEVGSVDTKKYKVQ